MTNPSPAEYLRAAFATLFGLVVIGMYLAGLTDEGKEVTVFAFASLAPLGVGWFLWRLWVWWRRG